MFLTYFIPLILAEDMITENVDQAFEVGGATRNERKLHVYFIF